MASPAARPAPAKLAQSPAGANNQARGPRGIAANLERNLVIAERKVVGKTDRLRTNRDPAKTASSEAGISLSSIGMLVELPSSSRIRRTAAASGVLAGKRNRDFVAAVDRA